ncbi:MAG: trigger factor [Candidatus Aminicenantes bacterium]
MKKNIKVLSGCKREIELDIDADKVMKKFNEIVARFSSQAKIRGFRPGKVPRDLIKQKFYPELKESLINSLVPKALNSELKAQNINPVGMPVVNDLHFKEGEPLRFKAQFEVWPEFELPAYKKIKVKEKKITVEPQEIEHSLEDLRARSAEYIPVERREVVDGDYVAVELKGKDLDTKRFLPLEKGVILAGHQDNEEALNKNLVGLKPGDERVFTIEHDEKHQNKRLAGKTIEYDMKVVSIKERKLPALDDEFAKSLGEFTNLKDLKEKIEKEIISTKERAAKNEMAEDIIKKISEKLNIELPEAVVEHEQVAFVRRLLSSLPQQNLSKEELDKMKSEGKGKAEQNIKNHLILKKIAEKEKLGISDEEIQEEFKRIAKANNLPVARVIEEFNKEGKRDELRDSLAIKKTVDFLVDNAIIER